MVFIVMFLGLIRCRGLVKRFVMVMLNAQEWLHKIRDIEINYAMHT